MSIGISPVIDLLFYVHPRWPMRFFTAAVAARHEDRPIGSAIVPRDDYFIRGAAYERIR